MEYKYYILSKSNNHALGVIGETESTLTIQKLKSVEKLDKFSGENITVIVPDESYTQTNNATVDKKDLSKVFEDVEITKDYWAVFEYLTGRKRKAVSQI